MNGCATRSPACAASSAPKSARSGCCGEPASQGGSGASAVAHAGQGRPPLPRARGAAQIRRLTFRAISANEKAEERSRADLSCPINVSKEEDDDGYGKA
jgi:hypothetical protein